MRKKKELTDPNSCMSRARDDEMTFVLLGRDKAAPAAIRAWINERVRLGKNKLGDPQTLEALQCAVEIEREQEAGHGRHCYCSECQAQFENDFDRLTTIPKGSSNDNCDS